MTLNETVLQKLAEWRPSGGRQTLNLPDEGCGWGVALTADRHDELGSLVWELGLHRTGDLATNALSLTDWAQGVAARVTGLLEPLKVVEVDHQRNEAILRSEEPAQRGQKLFYYEVLLRHTNQAWLRRYQAVHHGSVKREQVTFALTHEAVAKLVADVAAKE